MCVAEGVVGASHDRDVATLWPVEANRLIKGEASIIIANFARNLHYCAVYQNIWRPLLAVEEICDWLFFLLSEARCWISQKDVVE